MRFSTPTRAAGGDGPRRRPPDRVRLREHGTVTWMVSRERTRHFDPEAALRIETASGHGVHLHKVLATDAQERCAFTASPRSAALRRTRHRRAIRQRRFEEHLPSSPMGYRNRVRQKRLDKVWPIGRLKEKSRGIAQHYDILPSTSLTRPANAPPPCASSADARHDDDPPVVCTRPCMQSNGTKRPCGAPTSR